MRRYIQDTYIAYGVELGVDLLLGPQRFIIPIDGFPVPDRLESLMPLSVHTPHEDTQRHLLRRYIPFPLLPAALYIHRQAVRAVALGPP